MLDAMTSSCTCVRPRTSSTLAAQRNNVPRTSKQINWEAIWLNSSKNGNYRNDQATRYRVDVIIELEPVNAVNRFHTEREECAPN